MKPELLVIAGQLYRGEYVLKSCTHRPSSQGSWEYPKSPSPVLEISKTAKLERGPTVSSMTGTKSFCFRIKLATCQGNLAEKCN